LVVGFWIIKIVLELRKRKGKNNMKENGIKEK